MTDDRGGHRPVSPFGPTSVPSQNHRPTCCYLCGRRADGIGFGKALSDPKFLCELCRPIMDHIRQTVSFDLYELAAVEKAGTRAYSYLERIGKPSDITTLTAPEWNFFLREVIEGFGEGMRDEIRRGVPF